jgi:Ni,Fe-hydrogenase III small subunit
MTFVFYGSVDYNLYNARMGIKPFITRMNMGHTNACKVYIDKLNAFSTQYCPNKLMISASAGGYNNQNYYFENLQSIADSLLSIGVSATNVISIVSTNYQHLPSKTNVAGYASWGYNGGLGWDYATNGVVVFRGNSSWYLIKTIESFNGQQQQVFH